MKWLIGLLFALAVCGYFHCSPPASAGPGGSIAMPGPCDYPFVGHQTYAAGGAAWYCNGPVEENCSHWHVEGRDFNAGGPTGSGDYGIEFMGFGINIPGGIIGGGDGWQGYLYPDNTEAPWPNPPGAWKQHLVPRCPHDHDHPPPPPAPDYTGAVTNPDTPNPEATQNPQ